MPNPTNNQVHVNQPLTNISVAYIQDQDKFIADDVFPVVPVNKQSDVYYEYDKNDWLRDEAERRAPGTESAGGGYNLDKDETYFCHVDAYHTDIDDQTRDNADSVLDVDTDATEFVTQKLLLRKEREFVTNYFTSGVWANDYDGSTSDFVQFDDYANSDPIGEVDSGKEAIEKVTGKEPNKLVLGREVFTALKNHPDIIDRIKYTQQGLITEDILAGLFDVDEVYVANSIYATNNEGGTEAYDFNFGKGILLAYAPDNPGLRTPSAGYTFSWRYVNNVNNNAGMSVNKFRMEELKSDRVEGEIARDYKVIGADLGAFWANAVS